MSPTRSKILLMRPLLLSHECAIPYLRQMDKNRWYSNFGPLVQKLESRLAELFKTGEGSVVTTSSGTSALVNILRAMNLPRGTFCLVPSWTFAATPAAVVAAGLVPYFVDVDEGSWAITPKIIHKQLRALGGKVSAVMAVAPFGSPLNTAEWDDFTDVTGIPVIIDAAAGFDAFTSIPTAQPGNNPVMVSMHATKSFGIGEGGLVVSSNTTLIRRVREMSNFGFSASREIVVPGTNGKMSEHTAAFALAALDIWPQTREFWLCRKWFYAKAFKTIAKSVGTHPWLEQEWASSTFSIRLHHVQADAVIEGLNKADIESRQWWGKGCHMQPAYQSFPRASLPVTELLGQTVLALPFTLDIVQEDVDYIMQNLNELCIAAPSPKAKNTSV